jgi:allantoate deiminase
MTGRRGKSDTRRPGGGGQALRFGPALMARLEALARFTEVPGQLTRRYLSPAHVAAMREVEAWMRQAGMGVHTDALLSVIGRYEGHATGAPAIMLGSHIDTVVDAGKYDGALGVLAAIAAVAELARRGERLDHAIEVAAFGEEEGSRFPTHLLTSSALAGAAKPALLDMKDGDGISVREALAAAGGDAKAFRTCARKKGDLAAYLELHIEQGPVLDDRGLRLAAVTAINGSMRYLITVRGFAGHAGTVPMASRRDALSAASEMILAIEKLAGATPDLVATVGRIKALPGATNVIPGSVEFSIDMRGPSDAIRRRAGKALVSALRGIASRRSVDLEAETYQENPAVGLDARVIDTVADAVAACGQEPLRLASGAGHDAMIMQKLCPSGMIFLRCKDGISHNPAESISVEDADLGVAVLLEATRLLDRRLPALRWRP